MTHKPAKTPRSLPVLGQSPPPPPPPFDPAAVPAKSQLYWEYARNVTKKVVRAPFSLHTWAALRRTVLPQILPDELLYRWKPYQKGSCNRCGACCKIQFTCSFLREDEHQLPYCPIYQSEHAPKACLMFPIDPLDFYILQREIDYVCVFYYEGEPEPIPPFEVGRMIARHIVDRAVKRIKGRKRRPALESVD